MFWASYFDCPPTTLALPSNIAGVVGGLGKRDSMMEDDELEPAIEKFLREVGGEVPFRDVVEHVRTLLGQHSDDDIREALRSLEKELLIEENEILGGHKTYKIKQ